MYKDIFKAYLKYLSLSQCHFVEYNSIILLALKMKRNYKISRSHVLLTKLC